MSGRERVVQKMQRIPPLRKEKDLAFVFPVTICFPNPEEVKIALLKRSIWGVEREGFYKMT